MTLARRNLPFLLAALAEAQDKKTSTPSQALPFESLPVKATGTNKGRQVMDAHTHTGYHFDIHETELGIGMAPHAPHHHEHEEMVMVQKGTIEVTILDKATRLGSGGVAYVASNEEHGWKNVGDGPANYFVIAFGRPG